MSDHITKITSMNTVVDRIYTENNVVIDIYKPYLQCNEGDVISISIVSMTKPFENKTDYLMSGHVYYVDDSTSCISAGGLLCSVPKVLPIYSDVYISVKKNNKSKKMSSNEPKKLQKKK